jgi:hypothetical protein
LSRRSRLRPCVALAAAAAVSCSGGRSSPPAAASSLTIVSGDGQQAVAGARLPLALQVRAWGPGGAIAGAPITFAVAAGGGSIQPGTATTGPDGVASATATLGPSPGPNTFQATTPGAPSGVTFSCTGLARGNRLVYADPLPGGKLRLVRNPASIATRLTLDLVVNAPLTGYSAGFDLQLQAGRVVLPATGALLPGSGLVPGSPPLAAAAAIPGEGPLRGMLVAGLSQKAGGAGAAPADTALLPGAVLFSVTLELAPDASVGAVFDGAALGPRFKGGLRTRAGVDLIAASDIAVGALEVQP